MLNKLNLRLPVSKDMTHAVLKQPEPRVTWHLESLEDEDLWVWVRCLFFSFSNVSLSRTTSILSSFVNEWSLEVCHLPPEALLPSRPLWGLHAANSADKEAWVGQRGVLSLPLGCVVGELCHVTLCCFISSHRTPCRNELVTVLVVKPLGVFPYLKFLSWSMHKVEASKGTRKTCLEESCLSFCGGYRMCNGGRKGLQGKEVLPPGGMSWHAHAWMRWWYISLENPRWNY